MKPMALMCTLTPLDSNQHIVAKSFRFPAVELDDLVLLRGNEEMEVTEELMTSLSEASQKTDKVFVLLPPGTEALRIDQRWEPVEIKRDSGDGRG